MPKKSNTNAVEKLPEVDIAFQLLKEKGRPVYYRTLIEEVFELKPYTGDQILAIAAVHTQINLDPRFIYLGQGQWGLKAWVPAKSHKKIPSITLLNKTVVYDDQEKDSDDATPRDLGFYLEDEEQENTDNWEE